MGPRDATRDRLLAIIAIIAVGVSLRLTRQVTLPLAAAALLILLVWPLQMSLERLMPRVPAYVATTLLVLTGFAGFLAMIGWSASGLAERVPEFVERLVKLRGDVAAWFGTFDLEIEGGGEGAPMGTIFPVLVSGWQAVAMFFLTIAFFVLGLTEVRGFRGRLSANYSGQSERIHSAIVEVSQRVRGFIVGITLAGLLGGVLSLGYGALLGLEHVLVWAFLAYLLNYIPVVGSTISVFPPTLWALVQFEGMAVPLATLAGFSAIQFVVGNYVAPRFEGRYTRMSPVVVLVSILLWWLIWGAGGALLGVPLTLAILTASGYFEGTKWLALLLSEPESG